MLLSENDLQRMAHYLVQQHKEQLDVFNGAAARAPQRPPLMDDFEAALACLLWSELGAMGLEWLDQASVAQARQLLGVSPVHERWLEQSMRMLAALGYLHSGADGYSAGAAKPVAPADAWEAWSRGRAAWLDCADLRARATLVEATLRALPAILRGTVPATEIMFPDASVRLVEGVYKGNAVADYFNAVLADTLVDIVKRRPENEGGIRILEIGAGTGGTSAQLFTRLRPYQDRVAEYCYTDVSKAFLFHAEKEYGPANPYLTYRLFDTGMPLAPQGIEAGAYDVVVATNVLHATSNIRTSVRNAKAALRSGGVLLLNEISGADLFTHLTFGLLEGWWLYEDGALRMPGCPALSARSWQTVLEQEGFHGVAFPARRGHGLGQQVIAATSDGVARQAQVKAKAPVQVQALEPVAPPAASAAPAVAADTAQLTAGAVARFKKLISDTLRVPLHKIDAGAPLAQYGIDSILIVQLTNALRQVFDEVGSTLFFECLTINALAAHFVEHQNAALAKWLGLDQAPARAAPAAPVPAVPAPASAPAPHATQPAPPAEAMEVAIVGLAGRYAGAENVQQYWAHLKAGKNCITEVPATRWDSALYFDTDREKSGKMYSKWGGFIDSADCFDPLFFSISPYEAEKMSPQERLFLEEAYRSIEDAGYTPATLGQDGAVGVFVGVMNENYTGGARYWSVANRISYLLDFHGPSMAVDTACSSSLTALHQAVESLRSGSCTCAIAGGVNLILDPAHYLGLSAMAMLSAGDACKSFGADADGFVDGEGVGAVVLKPLHAAIAAGDQIYAVIKGSMVNAGGKTNGYTVPNPLAQTQVIADALRRAGVNARSVSYIEAHGTGTALGDPIEIRGLAQAFGRDTQERQFCAIGSAKSNIGHCESAAGIAGLTKVLLQMRHGQLAPSLHARALNPNIDFSATPFVVQQELAEWKRPSVNIDGVQREYPRIAGISSFGAGGANAHVVLQEYVAAPRPALDAAVPALIVLSARTADRLRAQVSQLLEALDRLEQEGVGVADIAYTLQVGREAMEERLAFSAADMGELRQRLQAYLAGEGEAASCHAGQARGGQDAALAQDEDMKLAVQSWVAKGKYDKLLEWWVKGMSFNWRTLYGAQRPRRVSLPGYPFVRERYWIAPAARPATATATAADAGWLHPLLQRNTSDVAGPRFSSSFSGEEFFLADHVIAGRRMMPAVAYLEMARAALAQAGGAQYGWQLRDVSWSRPLALRDGASAELHLALFPEADGTIGIEIYSEADGEMVLHSAATGLPGTPAAQYCDLAAARAACRVAELSAAQCYTMLAELGLDYGAAQRALGAVHVGDGQVLARLELPAAQAQEAHRYLLHPSLLDAALQAPIGLSAGQDGAGKAPLPVGLERIDILGQCGSTMWALVRTRPGARSDERVRKLDIDLCDADGKVCVRLVGFTSCVPGAADTADRTVLLEPEWRVSAVAQDAAEPEYIQHVVMICDMPNIAGHEIVGPTGARCIQIASHHNGMVDDFQRYTVAAFEEIKWILQARPAGKVLFQIVVPALSGHQLMAGLSGLLKTAHMENPHLIGQLIALDDTQQGHGLRAKLLENRRMPHDRHIRYQDDGRWVAGWKDVTASARTMHKPWKAGGVYLLTGGAGGLGLILAREIAQQAATPTLVLTGRSAPGAATQRHLQSLEALGARVQYVQADVADKAAVSALVDGIVRDYGTLDGIIHGAGIMRDNFILKKTTHELQAVLAPKTLGLLHLDEASRKLKLDFLICLSSLAGAYGNAGQADYAAANAFMDAYAVYRNSLVALEQRHGRTVSINWPLWQEGGMRMDQQAEQMLAQGAGMLAMASADGVAALYRVLATGEDQMVVMHGHAEQMRGMWQAGAVAAVPMAAPTAVTAVAAAPAANADQLAARATQYFTKLLSGVIKLAAERIDVAAPLDKYGIDSIMAMGLVGQLEKVFGALSKTLVFEHHTTQDLIDHFIETYPQKLQEVLGLNDPAPAPAPHPAAPAVPAPVSTPAPAMPAAAPRRRGYAGAAPAPRDDIAIVGLSGRYPQADNVEAFWDNLKHGKDSITEIPAGRWDHSLYFDPDRDKPGMTYSKWGGFIDGVDEFDPMFFGMPPLHAQFTDPQERLFLQCAYATLEDAGYTRETLARQVQGNVGVFVGVMYEEYQLFGTEAHARGRHVAVSSNPSSVANRVSYFCNFNGPSMAVNTMCSSSLTAIHLACQSLQEGDCELALAGGVNVSVHPNKYLMLGQGRFVSSTGQCESFGEGGDGYVPAEGVGAVLLKPLSKAIADGDHIYGVIKGSALNHGGKANGYTVPNPGAQSKVVARALRRAGVDARDISYVEAHGTGTSLGDPIEIAGLSRAFREQTQDKQFCAIGSVKSNIGHCESAAGIAALTKVLLQMRHGQLAPSLHSAVLNPHIDFAASPFVVQQELAEWKRPVSMRNGVRREGARIAGISSFGAGGSNAHLVIQEYAAPATSGAARHAPALVVLSARTVQALQAQARQLADALARHGWTDADLADIAYTLQTGREAMEERLAMQAGSLQALRDQLGDWLAGVEGKEEVYRGQVRSEKGVVGIFAADEDMAGIVDAWIAKGKYGKLLSLWVRGFGVDWDKLYGMAAPRRISLPTYPFAKERYWVPAAPAAADAAAVALAAPPVATAREAQLLSKAWEAAEAPLQPRAERRLAILAGAETAALAEQLAQRFSGSLVLDGGQAGELRAARDWKQFDGWIDLSGCASEAPAALDWITPLQQWVEARRKDHGVALCVTQGLERFRQSGVNLAGARRVGLYRMLQSEYGRLVSRHVDLESGADEAELIEHICAELEIDDLESEVCYRGAQRYRALLRGEAPAPSAALEELPRFEDGQVLLVTGGTRGIGYLCAQHAVRHYGARKLLLTGRDVFPAPAEWAAHQRDNGPLSAKMRAIESLRAQGAEVEVVSLALSDEAAVRACLDGVRRRLGQIAGVIHAAGLGESDTPVFARKSLDAVARVLEPKVAGLDVLLACVAQDAPRFCVLFSSVSALLPALAAGQSDYAMANAYMDYVAEAQTAGFPVLSLQWPSWKETGFGEIGSPAYARSGLLSHTDAEGLALLDHVLRSRPERVLAPAIVNPAGWRPSTLMLHQRPVARVAPVAVAVAPAGASAPALLAQVQAWLVALLADTLKMDAVHIDADNTFLEYGADSVLLLQLIRQVAQRIGGELDPSILFEYPTIAGFAAWLCGAYAAQLTAALQDTPAAPASAPVVRAPAPAPTPVHALRAMPASPVVQDIAVVGLSCRFPGAADLEQFWSLLSEGRSAIAPVPAHRWGYDSGHYAGLLDNISHFDPAFFLTSQADARAMDPQALLLLEETMKLFCHAGYRLDELKGSPVGVYVGARSRHRPDDDAFSKANNPVMTIGQNYLAANVSQFFDLHGPSLVLDSACSSALVGMSMAIQALRAGDITSAVVGGVNLLDTDGAFQVFEQRDILSREFHIFDARAGGAVLGEGIGLVLLKTVEQARRDGDRIYATIKAVAVNNDGRTAGPAAPSFQAQKAVMRAALERSGKRAGDIDHVEVNGSGTEVTDLLELKAIEAIYRADGSAPCSLGSIKPNIGHPLCAEGIASFIKVVLMLHHGLDVPFLSGQQPMRHYDMEASPFHFNRSASAWRGLGPRSAAINSFADGGTNVHAILEAWPAAEGAAVRRPLDPPPLRYIDVRHADDGGDAGMWEGEDMADAAGADEENFWGF